MIRPRRPTALALASLVVLALAGCTSSPVGRSVQPSATPSSAGSSSAETVGPTTAATAAAAATPVDIPCTKLVPADVRQQLKAGFTRVTGYVPPAGSDAARVAALHGTVCAWKGPGGATLVAAVARPAKHDETALKDTFVESSNAVPTYGEEAYFSVAHGVGTVEAFHGRYWIAAESTQFFEPGDAASLVAVADAVVAGKTPPSITLPGPVPTTGSSGGATAGAPSATPAAS